MLDGIIGGGENVRWAIMAVDAIHDSHQSSRWLAFEFFITKNLRGTIFFIRDAHPDNILTLCIRRIVLNRAIGTDVPVNAPERTTGAAGIYPHQHPNTVRGVFFIR